MSDENVVQQKFTALLKETCVFFEEVDVSSEKDLKSLQSLRMCALDLLAQRSNPAYGSYLAYILGVSNIPTHYPLQPIRFLSLIAATSQNLPSDYPIEDLALAAFFADLGFRASWLGHHNDHRNVVAYRLDGLRLPWIPPQIREWITYHHDPGKDTSPNKILSFYARLLELIHGLGTDQSKPSTFTPVRAMTIVMNEFGAHPEAVKTALRTLSAYPISAWVRLNTGEVCIVIGTTPGQPTRPIVGSWINSEWVVRDLAKETSLQITREEIPSTTQQHFMNSPAYWIPGWSGSKSLSPQELTEAFSKNVTDDKINDVIDHGDNEAMSEFLPTPELAPQIQNKIQTHRSNTAPRTPLDNPLGQEELSKIREDWNTRVKQVEEAVLNLKMGVIESYKRENESYKALFQELGANVAEGIPKHAKKSAIGLVSLIQKRIEGIETYLNTARESFKEKKSGLQNIIEKLSEQGRAIQLLLSKQSDQDPLTKLLKQLVDPWITRITQAEASLYGPNWADPAEFAALETLMAKTQVYAEELLMGKGLMTRWEDEFTPAMAQTLEKARVETMNRIQLSTEEIQKGLQLQEHIYRLAHIVENHLAWNTLQRGLTEKQKGQMGDAIHHFEEAVRLQNNFWEAYACLGLCYLGKKDKRAIPIFEAAIKLNPSESSLKACLELSKRL